MAIELSKNLKSVPENVFAPVLKLVAEESAKGKVLLNAAVGVPDSDTPELLLEELEKAIRKPENMRYGNFDGKEILLEKISEFLNRKYGVKVNPKTEIALLFGSKFGLAAIPSVLLNEGDLVFSPVPGYPDYIPAFKLAGAQIHDIELQEKDNYLVNYEKISEEDARRAKLIYLNYPSNPTGAVASKEFYEETVVWAKKNNVIVLQDHAYADFYYKEGISPSFLQVEGAKEVGIELFSFSKNFSMSGYRIGFAVGNEEIIRGLKEFNNIFNANIYGAIQDTVILGLDNYDKITGQIKKIYTERLEKITRKLDELGYEYFSPKGGIFIWLKAKDGDTGQQFFEKLLNNHNIVTMPGQVFGRGGEDYVRVSLSIKDQQIDTLLAELEKIN